EILGTLVSLLGDIPSEARPGSPGSAGGAGKHVVDLLGIVMTTFVPILRHLDPSVAGKTSDEDQAKRFLSTLHASHTVSNLTPYLVTLSGEILEQINMGAVSGTVDTESTPVVETFDSVEHIEDMVTQPVFTLSSMLAGLVLDSRGSVELSNTASETAPSLGLLFNLATVALLAQSSRLDRTEREEREGKESEGEIAATEGETEAETVTDDAENMILSTVVCLARVVIRLGLVSSSRTALLIGGESPLTKIDPSLVLQCVQSERLTRTAPLVVSLQTRVLAVLSYDKAQRDKFASDTTLMSHCTSTLIRLSKTVFSVTGSPTDRSMAKDLLRLVVHVLPSPYSAHCEWKADPALHFVTLDIITKASLTTPWSLTMCKLGLRALAHIVSALATMKASFTENITTQQVARAVAQVLYNSDMVANKEVELLSKAVAVIGAVPASSASWPVVCQESLIPIRLCQLINMGAPETGAAFTFTKQVNSSESMAKSPMFVSAATKALLHMCGSAPNRKVIVENQGHLALMRSLRAAHNMDTGSDSSSLGQECLKIVSNCSSAITLLVQDEVSRPSLVSAHVLTLIRDLSNADTTSELSRNMAASAQHVCGGSKLTLFDRTVDAPLVPVRAEGMSTLSITMGKVTLKDARDLHNAFLECSLVDVEGHPVTGGVRTRTAPKVSTTALAFDVTLHCQVATEAITEGLVLIFELKYFKDGDSGSPSTKCFTFYPLSATEGSEREREREGAAEGDDHIALDWYKKPTDPALKRLKPYGHTSKLKQRLRMAVADWEAKSILVKGERE
ncbi:hypothetical protein KIPB_003111, partial [Kipferlia bialata]